MHKQQSIKYYSLQSSVTHLFRTNIPSFLSHRKQNVDNAFRYKLIHDSPAFDAKVAHLGDQTPKPHTLGLLHLADDHLHSCLFVYFQALLAESAEGCLNQVPEKQFHQLCAFVAVG